MAVNAVRKLTLKEILKGKPAKDDDGKVVSQDFAVVYGQVIGMESGSTQFGDYTAFIGRFEARRIKDGEVFQSTRMILPKIAEEIIAVTVMEAKRDDPDAFVNVAFIFGAEYDERGTEGYKWTVKPVSTGDQAVDPLADLRASLGTSLQAMLPAAALSALALTDQSSKKPKATTEA